jgi:hypothetical protein
LVIPFPEIGNVDIAEDGKHEFRKGLGAHRIQAGDTMRRKQ